MLKHSLSKQQVKATGESNRQSPLKASQNSGKQLCNAHHRTVGHGMVMQQFLDDRSLKLQVCKHYCKQRDHAKLADTHGHMVCSRQ